MAEGYYSLSTILTRVTALASWTSEPGPRLKLSRYHYGSRSTIDFIQVLTNFEIGRRIVKYEQKGASRAVYGAKLIKHLSDTLTRDFGTGFSKANLEYMRRFFLIWQDRGVRIPQQVIGQLPQKAGNYAVIDPQPIAQQPIGQSVTPFPLSWTHYLTLMPIKDSNERNFYEIESSKSGWSTTELKRRW